MPSYRFCRPDDLGLIVRAYNTCYRLHYAEEPEMSEEGFKEQMTLFSARPGNCMVALEHQQPVGVVVSSKRDSEAWIKAIGCIPACQRQGIGAQLIEALIRKIAIQRTVLISVDVPTDNPAAVDFFTAVGFTVRGRFVTYQGELPAPGASCGRVAAIAASEALALYPSWHTAPACWERTAASLAAYGSVPQGYLYAVQGTAQGYLLHRGSAILDLAIAPQAEALQVVRDLLSHMRAAGWPQAILAKVPEGEPLRATLERLGFTTAQHYLLMGQDLQ